MAEGNSMDGDGFRKDDKSSEVFLCHLRSEFAIKEMLIWPLTLQMQRFYT